MAVLVEALTLVIRPLTLETRYPGGMDAWVDRIEGSAGTARYLSRAPGLIGASFYTDELEVEVHHLEEIGLALVSEDGSFEDFAVVDQCRGLVWPCSWLDWSPGCPNGWYSWAWLPGEAPERLGIPPGWIPGQEELVRDDDRLQPEMMGLSRDADGREHWLNLRNGKVLVFGPGDPSPEKR